MNNISEKIITLRKNNNITQAQLAKQLHVSRKTISNWENDRGKPDIQSLNMICDIYKVPLSFFIEPPTKKNKNNYVKNIKSKKTLLNYSYYFNIILTIASICNTFLIGSNHLAFVTPLLIINLCIFFIFFKDLKEKVRNNKLKIIIISLILLFITFFLELGISQSVTQINLEIIFGIMVHSISLTIGFDVIFFTYN
ncbi:transcriptional regulator [Philodulcilactobacillus myokoensis]|uniref:Transcriptional regulator n=1 Tax=Philodulcilactobacillus myokoensis TaxID=2929573 RepID=A0A9W6AZV9_9LACO|nr:helix-turn-helix transcriptional regulator [Philodulcilactobacillus myokoensis]GLB46128.1 transcriptional regulator [Philodulcilactobacillus myokoensis]